MGLLEDAKSIAKRDPAARGIGSVIFLYPGFHALVFHKPAHFFYRHRLFFVARLIATVSRWCTGIEIHPGATIGRRLFIDHGMGLVIGETAVVGDDCTIYHGVTLGGTGKERGIRHPTLGNRVLVGAGAKILGPFRVGDGAMIGANAVVLHEVPDAATVVGVPGRVIRISDQRIEHQIELDHGNVPDPVEQEFCKLLHRVRDLERLAGIDDHPADAVPFCDDDDNASEHGSEQTVPDDSMGEAPDEFVQ